MIGSRALPTALVVILVASTWFGIYARGPVSAPTSQPTLTPDMGPPTIGVIGAVSMPGYQAPSGTPAYDPANGLVYVPTIYPTGVAIVNNTTVVTTIPLPRLDNASNGIYPVSAVYNPVDGFVYVVEYDTFAGSLVAVINGESLIGTYTVGAAAALAVVNPESGYVYVLNTQSNFVSIFLAGTFVSNITVGMYPQAAAYVQATGEVALGGRGFISYFHGTTNVSWLSTNFTSGAMVYDPTDQNLYVAAGSYFLFVTPAGGIYNYYYHSSYTLIGDFETVVYDASNHLVYGISVDGYAAIVNGTNPIRTFSLGGYTNGAAYSPLDGSVYVANIGTWPTFNGNITIINSTGVVGSVFVGEKPFLPIFSAENGAIYVGGGDSVSEILLGYGTYYNVTITESGLPQNNSSLTVGATPLLAAPVVHEWTASSHYVTLHSIAKTITFREPFGRRSASIQTVPGPGGSVYVPSKSTLTFSVHGRTAAHVAFRDSFALTISESGLSPNSNWTVSGFGYGKLTLNVSSLTVYVHNGSYALHVTIPAGYAVRWSPTNRLAVSGGSYSVSINFTLRT